MIDEGVPNAVVGPVDGFVLTASANQPNAARALLTHLITDTDVQASWALAQGALSPNLNVDTDIYNSVMAKALDTVNAADTFAFNYDLATTPPAAEVGLDMFAQFMNDPSGYETYLEQTQTAVADVFEAEQ